MVPSVALAGAGHDGLFYSVTEPKSHKQPRRKRTTATPPVQPGPVNLGLSVLWTGGIRARYAGIRAVVDAISATELRHEVKQAAWRQLEESGGRRVDPRRSGRSCRRPGLRCTDVSRDELVY